MKIKVTLSIGFPGANQEEEFDFDDKELEGMTPEEIEEYLDGYAQEWAGNFIEIGYKEITD